MTMIRRWLTELLMATIRFYFVGREVQWMTRLGGQPLHRGSGRVKSARIDRGADAAPNGITFFWSMTGRPIGEVQRFPMLALTRDKTMGWVFYDDV